MRGKQRFKCHCCGKQFVSQKVLDPDKIWSSYSEGKQTYKQLASQYNCSVRTIQRLIDKCNRTYHIPLPRKIVLLMDTTYWGRSSGVMLFKDALTKENLLKYYVKSETNALYFQGIMELKNLGFTIEAIVCDGRRGLINLFPDTPVQMCQFHQVSIVRRYITKSPKIPAAIDLKEIVDCMKRTDKESFVAMLQLWYMEWETFLNERTLNEITGRSHYTHKRLRSAYRSIKTNLPWLFTWYEYMHLKIPNTTNAIDGHFSDLKNKLRNHNGLSRARKMKFIDEFLKA